MRNSNASPTPALSCSGGIVSAHAHLRYWNDSEFMITTLTGRHRHPDPRSERQPRAARRVYLSPVKPDRVVGEMPKRGVFPVDPTGPLI